MDGANSDSSLRLQAIASQNRRSHRLVKSGARCLPRRHPNQASKPPPDDSFEVPALFGSSMVYRRTMRYDPSATLLREAEAPKSSRQKGKLTKPCRDKI